MGTSSNMESCCVMIGEIATDWLVIALNTFVLILERLYFMQIYFAIAEDLSYRHDIIIPLFESILHKNASTESRLGVWLFTMFFFDPFNTTFNDNRAKLVPFVGSAVDIISFQNGGTFGMPALPFKPLTAKGGYF